MKDKHHTKETKRKISRTSKGKHYSPETEFKKGQVSLRKGIKLSKETIMKILRRRTPSSLESKFLEIIDKYNLPYKYVGNGSFFIGHYNPDFININGKKIAIEVYAKYHKRRNYLDIDKWKEKRIKIFKKYGWEILFFDEMQIKEDYILKVLSS